MDGLPLRSQPNWVILHSTRIEAIPDPAKKPTRAAVVIGVDPTGGLPPSIRSQSFLKTTACSIALSSDRSAVIRLLFSSLAATRSKTSHSTTSMWIPKRSFSSRPHERVGMRRVQDSLLVLSRQLVPLDNALDNAMVRMSEYCSDKAQICARQSCLVGAW